MKTWERPYFKTHEQVAFWLPKETAQAFKAACQAEGKSIKDALIEAIDLMLLTESPQQPPQPAQGENGQVAQ